ncbi:copper transporter [Nocardioides sp. InS609-2]|uniref:copper transporter n=1 Tax=Nocardioides sp. InS609-2 TaxID=2760705 RepID=UPI0020BD5EB1|nr:copper transporter [Nocardioides sp. InS609-2]
MITLRHHIVSLVAIFLALAVGVVLGGGPLSEVGRADGKAAAPDARLETAAQAAQRRADFGDAFAGGVAGTVYAGRLVDRSVAVVTLPGADPDMVASLSEQIGVAGGAVAGTYAVGETLVGTGEKSLVDTLGSQLMTQQPEGAVSAEATTYDRMGELIGLAVASTKPEGQGGDGKAAAILEGLAGADLLSGPKEQARRAPLVLVVVGDEPAADGGDTILAGLVAGLDRQAAGVVVAGDLADGPGQIGRLRTAGTQAATVDGIDSPAGRVAAVVALARSLTTPGGAFGASGSDGALPLG